MFVIPFEYCLHKVNQSSVVGIKHSFKDSSFPFIRRGHSNVLHIVNLSCKAVMDVASLKVTKDESLHYPQLTKPRSTGGQLTATPLGNGSISSTAGRRN